MHKHLSVIRAAIVRGRFVSFYFLLTSFNLPQPTQYVNHILLPLSQQPSVIDLCSCVVIFIVTF